MKKRIISGIIVFTLIITGINSGLLLFLPALDTDKDSYILIYNNTIIGQKGYYINGTPYLPISMIGTYARNSGTGVDQLNKRLVIHLSDQNIMMADEATTNFIKKYGGNIYIPLRDINGSLYFPLNTTGQLFKISYTLSGNSIKMRPISGTDKIEKIDLSKLDFYEPKKTKYKNGTEKISLAWDCVSGISPSAPSQKYNGLDILSPTWFHLIVDGDGNIENYGDKGYTDTSHINGYQVWATITNNMSTKGSTAFTTKTFNNSELLNKSVAQYIFYSCLYDVDGINIDYEDVADGDAAGLVAFTALMRNYTERQGLVLSIDTLIPRPWTEEYDRASLANYVDYLAVMTYDEHYSGSPVAGSVSSLPWAEDAIIDTLKDVPASKVLMGVPLYTRIWTVDAAGKIITNPAAKMKTVRNTLQSKNIVPVWMNEEKQYYAEYSDGTNISKIWIEDSRSIANRLNLVTKYKLAGAACWQLNQGETLIWDVFDGMLKQGKPFKDYEKNY